MIAAGASSARVGGRALAAVTAPANTSPPTISGTAQQGSTLTASSGTWSGDTPVAFAYQWERCDSAGASCSNISGATGQTYALASADVGQTLRVAVTASNSAGSALAVSNETALVAAPSSTPVNTVRPAVSGSAQVGHTLTGSSGTWTGTQPISFSFQWQRCDADGGNCQFIQGQTGLTYKVASADAGHRLLFQVTARNSVGTASADATTANVPGGGAPTNTVKPSLSGSFRAGGTLTGNPGSWSGTGPVALAFQWQRCGADGGNCQFIQGETAAKYTIAAADLGHRLLFQVKASNSLGTSSAFVTTPTLAGTAGSVDVTGVSLPERLVIDKVSFSPSRIESRSEPLVARFHVSDTRGLSVASALVFAVGVPFGRITAAPEALTGADGWATLTFRPLAGLPLRRGTLLVLFVRARKPGESVLAGVSTRRLVSVLVSPR